VPGAVPDDVAGMVETTVVDRAAAGESAAWRELTGEYDRVLRGVARRFRLPSHDADDAAQATWLALYENLPAIREPASLGGWLAVVMRRRCLALVEARRRVTPVDDLEWWAADTPAEPPPPQEGRALLWRLVDGLPDRERAVVLALFDGSDRSYREIAADLGMPIGAVGPVRMRALRRLEARLAEAGITSELLSVMV
jgi:RNA polymerase sigma factor (sigma-70 family)